MNEKSRTISFILTLFFGPLGLLYSTVAGGLILIVVAILTGFTIIGPAICWVLAIAIGDHCTHRHNQGLDKLRQAIARSGQYPGK